jgi:hypothetical protein
MLMVSDMVEPPLIEYCTVTLSLLVTNPSSVDPESHCTVGAATSIANFIA